VAKPLPVKDLRQLLKEIIKMVNKGLNYSPVIMMPDYRAKMHSALNFVYNTWMAA